MDDVVIVGGGIIGTATAYFLSKEGRKVKVIERDPTYKTASFPLSLGGFRRQFFQTENILLGKFAREFIFQIPELLKTEKNPKPTASMVTNGYLLMFGPEHAEEQYRALENHKACEAGTKNIKGSELTIIKPPSPVVRCFIACKLNTHIWLSLQFLSDPIFVPSYSDPNA